MNDDTYEPASGNPDRQDGHEPDGTALPDRTDGRNGLNDDGNGPNDDGHGTDDKGNGPDDGHGTDDTSSADGMDEDALRRLLHGAVGELKPSPDSLEHLRRAVPARRTRRRQALIGAVAAVVLGGAALPALVHVARTGGSDDRPAMAGSSHRTPDPDRDKHGEDSGGKETGRPSDTVSEDKQDKGGDGKKDRPSKKPEGDAADGVAPDPSSTLNATSPTCSRPQLGNASGTAGTADAEGRVYGSFRVMNISDTPCTVVGGGSISPSALGGADGSRVFVVDHTSGDAASGLPDPSTAPGQLILKPGQAYEVKFAWIPESGGGTSGCSNTSATPTPDPTPDSADAVDGGPSDSPSDGSGSGGGGEQPTGSVLLSYTPEAGDPAAASVTLSGACAGTIYRTGVLAAV